MNDRFAEMAQKWGEEACGMMRRASCDRFPNGCPECPSWFADGIAAMLRTVDAEARKDERASFASWTFKERGD